MSDAEFEIPAESAEPVGKAGENERQPIVAAPKLRENLTALDEVQLLRRAGQGDERAVRALYRNHVDRVYSIVSRVLGGRNASDVEDVVQKVFLAALESATNFEERSSVASWIAGIATRKALDEARARWRRDRWSRMTVTLASTFSAGQDTRVEALRSVDVLARLTPEQRTAFVLKEVEGYTFQEISEMTGEGISTLHARVGAARKRIDELLGGWC